MNIKFPVFFFCSVATLEKYWCQLHVVANREFPRLPSLRVDAFGNAFFIIVCNVKQNLASLMWKHLDYFFHAYELIVYIILMFKTEKVFKYYEILAFFMEPEIMVVCQFLMVDNKGVMK